MKIEHTELGNIICKKCGKPRHPESYEFEGGVYSDCHMCRILDRYKETKKKMTFQSLCRHVKVSKDIMLGWLSSGKIKEPKKIGENEYDPSDTWYNQVERLRQVLIQDKKKGRFNFQFKTRATGSGKRKTIHI